MPEGQKKRKMQEDKSMREERKRMREERKKLRQMTGDQTAHQAAKTFKNGEKKNHQCLNSRLAVFDVTPLASRSVCVCLLAGLEPSCGGW
jgi:hypothetical protein